MDATATNTNTNELVRPAAPLLPVAEGVVLVVALAPTPVVKAPPDEVVALKVATEKVVFAVLGLPVPMLPVPTVPTIPVPIVVVTEMTVEFGATDESAPARVERTALTEETDADGARVVLDERAEK